VARALATNRPRIERCLDKALQMGPMAALSDLPGRGHPTRITDDAKAWVTSLACQKPKDPRVFVRTLDNRPAGATYSSVLQKERTSVAEETGRGTVSKILARAEIRPHKIQYYLERRDEEFERKMAEVLCVYKEVELLRKSGKTAWSPY